jgi:hypothetical protein
MWPWGHLAVGYLAYSLYTHARAHRPPRDWPVGALAVGTQFPDLIDKPLAWTFGVLPTGRSLTHSLVTALLCIVILRLLVRQRYRHRRALVTAFSLGYLSHLGADALGPLLAGEYASPRFLAWPIVPAIDPATDKSFLTHFLGMEFTPFVLAQLGLVGLALGLWRRDGVPGIAVTRHVTAYTFHAVRRSR